MIDLSDEYEIIDNLETIQYTPKTVTDGQSLRVKNVLRRALKKDFLSGTTLHDETIIFHIWVNQLPDGFIPQVGDHFITVSDPPDERFIPERFNVLQVEEQTFRTRWRLSCQGGK